MVAAAATHSPIFDKDWAECLVYPRGIFPQVSAYALLLHTLSIQSDL